MRELRVVGVDHWTGHSADPVLTTLRRLARYGPLAGAGLGVAALVSTRDPLFAGALFLAVVSSLANLSSA
jgi:hypothetical protein